MPSKKLKRAPLKEVAFDIYWRPSRDQNETTYDFALGRFQERVVKKFSVIKRILPPNVRIQHQAAFQFWTRQGVFPVIQMGDGVMTVNDTDKNYTWEDFRNNIEMAMTALIDSYGRMPEITIARLKYIDSVDIDANAKDTEAFIRTNHLTGIVYDYELPGTFRGLSISQTRNLDNNSVLTVSINTAVNNVSGRNAIIWSNQIERAAITTEKELVYWLDSSHAMLSKLFVTMMHPQYYARFD